MKIWKKIIALLTVSVLLFAVSACGSKFKYKDQTDRPTDMQEPITRPQVVYPEYPDTAPSEPAEGTEPSVVEYKASFAASPYTLKNEEDGLAIEYADITDYAYIYVPVKDYTPEYGNIKITLENGTPAAERVGIQAIYYEAKELGYSPVTVFIDRLIEGEQYLVSELGEWFITDANYQTLSNQSVRDKTIIGFVIFIDSLPSFMPEADTIGTCKIKNFEFLKDDDPKLADRYVAPDASIAEAYADDGITLNKGENLVATASSGGKLYLPISRYSSDYGEYVLNASGSGEVKIGVRYGITKKDRTRYSTPKTVALSSESTDYTYNYVKDFIDDPGDDIKTQFIRGCAVTYVYIELSAGAEITVNGVTFKRTVQEGPYVTDVWKGCSGVEVERVVAGGNAKLNVEHYTGWMASTLSIQKGQGVQKIVYIIYAPDGLNHIGFVVSTNSQLGTDGQNPGNYVVRGSTDRVNGNNSAASPYFVASQNLEGVKEKIEYDSETKIYKFTYDFTEMVKDKNGNTFADYTVNSLMFYLNDPNAVDEYEGVRRLYFLSIDLFTE